MPEELNTVRYQSYCLLGLLLVSRTVAVMTRAIPPTIKTQVKANPISKKNADVLSWKFLDVYLDLELDLLICQGLPSGLYLVMLHTCRTLGTGMNCPSLSLRSIITCDVGFKKIEIGFKEIDISSLTLISNKNAKLWLPAESSYWDVSARTETFSWKSQCHQLCKYLSNVRVVNQTSMFCTETFFSFPRPSRSQCISMKYKIISNIWLFVNYSGCSRSWIIHCIQYWQRLTVDRGEESLFCVMNNYVSNSFHEMDD